MAINLRRDADNALPFKRSTVVATKGGLIAPKPFGASNDIGLLVIDAPSADKSGIVMHFWCKSAVRKTVNHAAVLVKDSGQKCRVGKNISILLWRTLKHIHSLLFNFHR